MVEVVSPPLPKGSGERSTSVTVRLTVGELAAVKEAAQLAGRAQHSRWAREQLLAAAARDRQVRLDGVGGGSGGLDAQDRLQLIRIGSNLNQLARAANQAAGRGERLGAVQVAIELRQLRAELARIAGDEQ